MYLNPKKGLKKRSYILAVSADHSHSQRGKKTSQTKKPFTLQLWLLHPIRALNPLKSGNRRFWTLERSVWAVQLDRKVVKRWKSEQVIFCRVVKYLSRVQRHKESKLQNKFVSNCGGLINLSWGQFDVSQIWCRFKGCDEQIWPFKESDRKILIHPLNQKSDVSLLGQDSDFHGYLLSSFCVILPTNKHN